MDKSLVFDRYFNLSLKFISYRPRSEKEVYDYLKKKQKRAESLTEETIARIMKRLVELNFINDLEFSAFWLEHRKKSIQYFKNGTQAKRSWE
jgi:regulatory protein